MVRTGGGPGWEESLAGDGFGVLESPISHRDDRGAAYQQEPELEGEKPG